MTEELQQSVPEFGQEKPPVLPASISYTHPQESNKNLLILLAVAISILCCCSIICIAAVGLGGLGMGSVLKERAPVEAVLDSYMKYMDAKDAKSAYELFSPRAQRQFSSSKVEELLEGNNYVIFEGYQSLSVADLKISAAANTNPNMPQGTVATVTGTILYEGGIQGSFNGTLEKVNGKWQLHSINVTVPPSKIK